MSFYVDNIQTTDSVEQSLLQNQNINLISYTPVWIYNSENATSPGNITQEPITGYKTVNIIDANGVNITYWLKTLNSIIITKNNSVGSFNNIYVSYVDTNNNFTTTGISSLTNNNNNTYTLLDGDLYTVGTVFTNNNKIYASIFTN